MPATSPTLTGRRWPGQLELTARQPDCPSLAARIAGAAPGRPRQTRWSHRHQTASHQVLTGHSRGVSAVATAELPDGTPVVISHGIDVRVRVWRLAENAPLGKPLRGHRGPVSAVATGALPDGTPVIGGGGRDGTVRVWRLADGTRSSLRCTYPNRSPASPLTATSS